MDIHILKLHVYQGMQLTDLERFGNIFIIRLTSGCILGYDHVKVNCELAKFRRAGCVDVRICFCLFCLFDELVYYLLTMTLSHE